jgi:hypothetical protein
VGSHDRTLGLEEETVVQQTQLEIQLAMPEFRVDRLPYQSLLTERVDERQQEPTPHFLLFIWLTAPPAWHVPWMMV